MLDALGMSLLPSYGKKEERKSEEDDGDEEESRTAEALRREVEVLRAENEELKQKMLIAQRAAGTA